MWDVFVSYRWVDPDCKWVRNELVPCLRNAGLRVFLDVDDFVPGRDVISEMTRAGQESKRTLSVWTPDYFAEDRAVWFESLQARRRDPQGRLSKLVPLLLRATKIPGEFFGLAMVDWTAPQRHSVEWNKLLSVLDAPTLNVRPPQECPAVTSATLAPAVVALDSAQHHVLARISARLSMPDPVERYWLYIALGFTQLPEASALLHQAASTESDPFARIGIDDAREMLSADPKTARSGI